MAALITFPAADIHLEGVEVAVELSATWMRAVLADTEVSPRVDPAGRLTGRLSRSGNDIVVRTRVKAAVSLPCARCLEPTSADVDTELSLLLQPASQGKPSNRGGEARDYEFSSTEADTDVYDGEVVVLDNFVREAILLEVPTFPLCRESCPGMASPPDAEEERAPDPRFAALNAFRNQEGPATVADLVAAAEQRAAAFGRKPRLRSHQRGPRRRKR
jgi:uncharacterized protein